MSCLEDLLAHGNVHRFTTQGFSSRIECADGFSLSVIAGGGAYSTPRTAIPGVPAYGNDLPAAYAGPFTAVEVGFPTARPEPWIAWQQYCEDADAPTETVYGYVPADLVGALVAMHGGEA